MGNSCPGCHKIWFNNDFSSALKCISFTVKKIALGVWKFCLHMQSNSWFDRKLEKNYAS